MTQRRIAKKGPPPILMMRSHQSLLGSPLKNAAETKAYIQARLKQNSREVFACLFLDVKNEIISFDEIFYGNIRNAEVYPREVVKAALKHNAAGVVLAHNHPSGSCDVSTSDIELTRLLKEALKLVDVYDHVIVADDRVVSLGELGLVS